MRLRYFAAGTAAAYAVALVALYWAGRSIDNAVASVFGG